MKSIVYRNQSFVNKKYHKSIVQFIASYIYDCCNLWFDLSNFDRLVSNSCLLSTQSLFLTLADI